MELKAVFNKKIITKRVCIAPFHKIECITSKSLTATRQMLERQRLTLLYVLETIIVQIAYLENVSVSNNCTIHKLSIVTGYISLKECHSVNSSTTEGCWRSIHAQTTTRHCSRTMGTDRISFITCCNLFNHEAICEFALPCEALRIKTVFHHVTDISGTVLAHKIEKGCGIRANLCYVGFKSNSIDPNRRSLVHVGTSNKDRTQFPGVEAASFECAVFTTIIHTIQIRMDILKLE